MRNLFPAAGQWMHAAIDSATDGILIEADECVVYVNAAYTQLLGYRRETDLVRRRVAELISGCDAERLVRFGRLRTSGKRVPSSYDFAALRKDGTPVRLHASVSLFFTSGTNYILTIARAFPESDARAAGGSIGGAHDALSPREQEVMQMLLAGKRPKIIAFELGLTEKTVATHRARLLGKIGLTDNRELYQYALRHRLVDWA